MATTSQEGGKFRVGALQSEPARSAKCGRSLRFSKTCRSRYRLIDPLADLRPRHQAMARSKQIQRTLGIHGELDPSHSAEIDDTLNELPLGKSHLEMVGVRADGLMR
jgi:hypothetical protein